MKEKEIRVLKGEPHEHPKGCILKNTLEALQEAVDWYIDIIGLEDNIRVNREIVDYDIQRQAQEESRNISENAKLGLK